MKVHLIALAAWALSAPAIAQTASKPVTFPDWVSIPSGREDAYPAAARSHTPAPSGQAVVQCHLQGGKHLDHCSVVSETPAGVGFGDAAAIAASLSDAASPPPNSLTPNGDVIIPVTFDGAAAAIDSKPTPAGQIVTNPDWLTKPSASDLERYFPERAQQRGVGGKVKMACNVTATGSLDGCRIVSETPEGFGFGAAALAMAKIFSMRPKMVDGEPVAGAVVLLPFNFGAPDAKLFLESRWAQTPTPAQIAAAFPQAGVGVEVGRVAMSCGVSPNGRLRACQAATEDPPARGFGDAAKSLAPDFQLDAAAYGDKVGGINQVTLPITFYAPGAETVDPITKPAWTRMIDLKTMQSLFPAKAAEAGLKAGKGTVDCIVDHAGRLTQCRPIAEEPADMDFGVAAARVASALAINPWTSQGRPVDGAHIHLPIVLTLSPEAKP